MGIEKVHFHKVSCDFTDCKTETEFKSYFYESYSAFVNNDYIKEKWLYINGKYYCDFHRNEIK